MKNKLNYCLSLLTKIQFFTGDEMANIDEVIRILEDLSKHCPDIDIYNIMKLFDISAAIQDNKPVFVFTSKFESGNVKIFQTNNFKESVNNIKNLLVIWFDSLK